MNTKNLGPLSLCRSLPDRLRPNRHAVRRRQIVETIRRLYAEDQPLNITAVKRQHPELIRAVYDAKPFWGWKQALADAGIDYPKIRVELQETVECELCGKSFYNLAPHLMKRHEVWPDEYLMDYPDAVMHSEALRARRKWRGTSILCAWEPIWSPEYILDRMSEYRRRGFRMNIMKMRDVDIPLVAAATLCFGSWARALRRIGLNSGVVFRQLRQATSRYPDKEAVVKEIRRRWNAQLPLCSTTLTSPRGDYALILRGVEYFGSWFDALKAAKIDPSKVAKVRWPGRSYMSAGAVKDAIRERAKRRWPLHYSGLRAGPRKDKLLYYRGQRYFGSWDQALRASGIDPEAMKRGIWRRYVEQRFPDKSALLTAIRRRRRAGLSMRTTDLQRGAERDNRLYQCAIRMFGSWKATLDAAGLDGAAIAKEIARTRRKYATAKDVLRAIRSRIRLKWKVHKTALCCGDHSDNALLNSGVEYFGAWDKALAAAGVNLLAIRKKPPVKYRYPDRRSVVAAIGKRRADGFPINHGGVAHGKDRNSGLIIAAYVHFGSWDAALRASRIDPDKMRRTLSLKQRRYSDKASVVKGIRTRHSKHLLLSQRQILKGKVRDNALVRSAIEYFGSWDRALRAARIRPLPRRLSPACARPCKDTDERGHS